MNRSDIQSEADSYSHRIDAETWAFIERTQGFYRDTASNSSVDELRACYNAMSRDFHSGVPKDVTTEDLTISATDHEIPTRHYVKNNDPGEALVIYYHGGGFVVGDLESHDDVCADICHVTGFEVVAVDYRLAPEHQFPRCFDDALTAFRHHASKSDRPIILVGDSGGGNLCAAVAHATRNSGIKPSGQVLIYPGLGADRDKGSYLRHRDAPLLTLEDIEFYFGARGGGKELLSDPRFAPLAASEFSNLPPSVVFSAEIDPLCDDGENYVTRLKEAGVAAVWHCETGLVHGYLRGRNTVKRVARSFERITDAITILGRGESQI